MRPVDRAKRLHALAAKQHGAFTRQQSLALGYSVSEIRRRLRGHEWIKLHPGVYAIAGSSETWERRATAVLLYAGDSAALSHFAAASCLQLIDGRPSRIDLAITTAKKSGNGRHRVVGLARTDVRKAHGFPVTCPERTLVDLAGVAPRRILEGALDRAIVQGLTTLERTKAYIESRGLRNRRGVGVLVALIEDRERLGVTESELERRFLEVVRTHRLSEPLRQRPIVKRRVDFLYVDEQIFVEVDGRGAHELRVAFEDDRRRQNELVLAGLLPLRFTWDDVTERRSYVAETVRRALRDRAGGGS